MATMNWLQPRVLTHVLIASAGASSGCSLVLDFSQPVTADATPDAVASDVECLRGEPNNTSTSATSVTSADAGSAGICEPGDVDFYRFAVEPTSNTVTINVGFVSAAGDLDLRLFASDGTTALALANSFGDNEVLTCPSAKCTKLTAGTYYLAVFGGTATDINRYTLRIDQSP
jgi:hypothetical protein